MKDFHKIIVIFVFTITIAACPAQDVGTEIVIGKTFSIQSEILKEKRPIIIYTPDNYSNNSTPVTVMYLLDGQSNFIHTTGIVSFLQNRGRIPKMMIVAIPNTSDRTHDLSPSIKLNEEAKKNMRTAGGAENMLQFISDELIPYIDENYNTGNYRILVGHSFGGLFAVYTLLNKPDIFDAYIAISPSMWWDDQNQVKKAQEIFKSDPDLNGYFYMTMGDEDGEMLGGAMKLAAVFEESQTDEFNWDFKIMKDETHGTVPLRSTYYGLEAIFKDWYRADLSDLYVLGGMQSIDAHYASVNEKLGFELKPSEEEMNMLGYTFLNKDQYEKAIEIFDENVKRFPESFNVYDSRGEAFKNKGDNENAIIDYMKSMELHPGNTNGVKMLNELGKAYDPDEYIVELKPKKLEKYTGNYDLSLNGKRIILKVELVASQLKGSALGVLPMQDLIPYGNNHFLAKQANMPVLFKMNNKGIAVGIRIQTNNTNFVIGAKEK
jgi:predicted alpha/beta superfamily hydrolase